MQNNNRYSRWHADRQVVQLDLRHHLAGVELEVMRDPFALLRLGIIRSEGRA